jgi:hypothetical protein
MFKLGKGKKLPEGTKEQGGLETFKFKSSYNSLDKKYYISLTSRKTFHTARLNLDKQDYEKIVKNMNIELEKDYDGPLKGLRHKSEVEYRNIP